MCILGCEYQNRPNRFKCLCVVRVYANNAGSLNHEYLRRSPMKPVLGTLGPMPKAFECESQMVLVALHLPRPLGDCYKCH